MSVRCLLLCLVLGIGLIGCEKPASTTASKDQPAAKVAAKPRSKSGLAITQVRADRIRFDPAKDESVTISFVINRPADTELLIYDGRNRLVRRIADGDLQPGEHHLVWDGKDEQSQPVPPEAYVYAVTATDAGGRVVHDVTDLTGGEALQAQDVRWDAAAGKVHYRLDRPARVNIRFGLPDGGPFLRTLIDWVPRPVGAHTEAWDGWDQSQVLKLAAHPKLVTSVNAYSVSDNTLLVGVPPQRVTFAQLQGKVVREPQVVERPKRMYFHPDQPLETRGDIGTSLKIEGDLKQDQEGRWIVTGKVPIRLDVAAQDRARVIERRFEPVFYVDGIFAFENEGGFLPMTWLWDTSTVNEGEHYVTTNVRGYEGNFGTATLKVWVVHAANTPESTQGKILGSTPK